MTNIKPIKHGIVKPVHKVWENTDFERERFEASAIFTQNPQMALRLSKVPSEYRSATWDQFSLHERRQVPSKPSNIFFSCPDIDRAANLSALTLAYYTPKLIDILGSPVGWFAAWNDYDERKIPLMALLVDLSDGEFFFVMADRPDDSITLVYSDMPIGEIGDSFPDLAVRLSGIDYTIIELKSEKERSDTNGEVRDD